MNSITQNRNILMRARITKVGARRLQNTKSFALLIISAALAGTLCLSPAIFSLMSSVIIRSSGQISIPTITAASGYWQDIQTAVNWVVARGGIGNVYIPEGTFNFVEINEPWKYVTVPGGVNVFGAGKNGTILVQPEVPPVDSSMFQLDGSDGKPIRISGIYFKGKVTDDESQNNWGIGVENAVDFRIDHCRFTDFCAASICTEEDCCGVIDHNDFDNPYKETAPGDWAYGILVFGDGSTWRNLDYYLGKYDIGIIYIEDNTFERCRYAVAANLGGWYVFRHNQVIIPRNYGSWAKAGVDVHEGFESPARVGGRGLEAYDNTFTYTGDYGHQGFKLRAGSGVIYNNTISVDVGVWLIKADWATSETNYVKDLYIWDNTYAAIPLSADPFYQENVHYFLYAKEGYTSYQYPHPLTLEATP